MMYQTFCMIIDYLEETNKIIFAKDKTIVWIWDPVGIRRLLLKGVKLR